MTAQNNLEIKGNLREHPLAGLLVEISRARLNGSLRISRESQKTIVYFDAGEVVFAVSNARSFRLFEMLLRDNKIAKEQLSQIADFTNDLLLGQNLLKNDLLSEADVERLFVRQIEDILKNGFEWLDGNWAFSPLVRIKGDIRYRIGLNQLLMEYARILPDEAIARAFQGSREFFNVKPTMPADINLSPQESFVFSRFENSALTMENVKILSGLPDTETLRILYTLWLGGFLERRESNSAFSARQTSEILSARVSLMKRQNTTALPESGAKKYAAPTAPIKVSVEKVEPLAAEISLEHYLAQVEGAADFYEILDVKPEVAPADIKQAYFARAKRFHPDLFHKESDALLQQRVQQAFSKLAQAYDTLRDEKKREVYDYKMRKESDAKEKRQKTGAGAENTVSSKQFEQASDEFEQGFSLLMDDEFEAAIPYLARAAHLADDNARFHAYYGKALTSNKNMRHKAEAELQIAVKLDGKNPDYRLMLAEFFIEVGLLKRAEGELGRLLTAFPANQEAKILLDSLQRK